MLIEKPETRLVTIDAPKKFTISGITDQKVLDLLAEGTTTYEFQLNHNITVNDPRPIELIDVMQKRKWVIVSDYKGIVESFDWNS